MKTITQNELNERSKRSKEKRDHVNVTLPKGTIARIAELTDDKVSTFCQKAVLKYLEELESKQ